MMILTAAQRPSFSFNGRRLRLFCIVNAIFCGMLTACPSCEENRGDIAQSLTLSFWSNRQNEGPLDERLEAPWVWGFQGGTMVRPILEFAEGVEVYDGEEFDVVIRNEVLPDSENPDAFDPVFQEFRMRGMVFIDEETGRAFLGPFDNQLGWASLEGLHMKFAIEVSSFSGSLTPEVRLVEVLSRTAEKCEPFLPTTPPASDTECVYARLSGTARISDVETVGYDSACSGNAAMVWGTFEPSGPEQTACLDAYIASGWPDPRVETFPVALNVNATQICLAQNGVRMDTVGAAEYAMRVGGNCTSTGNLIWAADLSVCDCNQRE